MSPIRCLAVDDEAYAGNIMADYIRKVPFFTFVGTTVNPLEALTAVQEGKVDLVFLDIQMPELTGIQFLKLCGSKCKIILTTAYPQYALEGYEHDVIDYLLKPVPFDRFLKAANKAFQVLSPPHSTDQATEYIFIKGDSKHKYHKIDVRDIIYIEGLKNYISLFTASGRVITYQSLRELEKQLPPPAFIRVHKSYIVSMAHIKMVDGNTIHIGESKIPVGETYRDHLFSMIHERYGK